VNADILSEQATVDQLRAVRYLSEFGFALEITQSGTSRRVAEICSMFLSRKEKVTLFKLLGS